MALDFRHLQDAVRTQADARSHDIDRGAIQFFVCFLGAEQDFMGARRAHLGPEKMGWHGLN
jgi:hypothetical protein